MIVRLTPGRHQMWLGVMAARNVLRRGGDAEEALEAAAATGGFAGTMRRNLVNMLDGIGVADWLDLETTDLLWAGPWTCRRPPQQ